MKKSLLSLSIVLLACALTFSQNRDKKIKEKKPSKEEIANMTPEQHLAYENNRLAKKGKKMNADQKANIQRKHSKAARSMKPAKANPSPKPKD